MGWCVMLCGCYCGPQAGPRKVLIVKKPVAAAASTLKDMAAWLQKRGLQVGYWVWLPHSTTQHEQHIRSAEQQGD